MADNYSHFAFSPTIEQCVNAIAGNPCFRQHRKDDYIVFNYDYCFKGTFPDPKLADTEEEATKRKILRECRGIIFHVETGKVLARRYHKFFNLNELPETQEDLLDITRPHVILDKMDGCLVTPFMSLGALRWGTKMGITDLSKELETDFLPSKPLVRYAEFSSFWINNGYTPMYEYCSLKQQIVVSYPEDMLILTAIRNNETGAYVTYNAIIESAQKYNVPVTKPLQVNFGTEYKTLGELLQHVKTTTELEGFVLCFENGEFYKLKTQWYFERSRKIAGSFTGQEKELWDLILNRKIDDLGGVLGEKRTELLEKQSVDLWAALGRSADKINKHVKDFMESHPDLTDQPHLARKLFKDQMESSGISKLLLSIYFKVFEGRDALELVVAKCIENINNKNRLNDVRDALAEGIVIRI